MINQHNTTIRLVLFIGLTFLYTAFSNAQDCVYLSKANDIIPYGKCAPVDVDWEVVYRGVDDKGTGNIQIQYDWDDGNPVEVINAALTDAGLKEWSATHSHNYPNTGDLCNYHPRATLIVNGVVCTSSVQEQIVTVWDTDDRNGGELTVDPEVYPICVGNGASFNFTDVSQWNCTPPDENDVVNNENRWIQWIYGTGGTTILDAEVGGSIRTYPWTGPIDHVPGPVEGPIAPYNTSMNITIPDHHPVGAFFQVTLRNWNVCNPYDDPDVAGPPIDLVNGDFPPVTTTAMAIIVALPDASIQPVPAVCESADPFILIPVDGGGEWSGPGIIAPNNAMFYPEIAGPGTHTITYSITDGNNCSDVGTINITVLPAPKANILQDTPNNLCPGITLNLDGNPTLGQTPYTHLWKGDTSPLTSTSISNPQFSATTVDQYELIYRVTDANSCWNEDTIVVNVEEVNITFTNSTIESCLGETIPLDPAPVGGSEVFTTHLWTGTRTDLLSDVNIQNPEFSANETGTFEFTYTVRDTYGCEDSDIITIIVHEQPNANAGMDLFECGLQSQLNATPSVGNGLWKVINGPGILSFQDFAIPNPQVTSDTYGVYRLRWIENNNSCTDSTEINLTFSELPIPTVMEDKDTCGTKVELIAYPHVGTGQWSKAEGSGNASFVNSSNPITSVTVDSPGKYKFVWAENNGNGCVGSDTVTINFFQIPEANIIPPPAIGCTPMEIQFQNTSLHADSYNWDFGNGIISNDENPLQIFTNKTPDAIHYDITLIARTTEGCVDTLNTTTTVAPTPVAYFESKDIIGCSPLRSQFTNKSQGGDTYNWTFGDGSQAETTEHTAHDFINEESFTQSFEVTLATQNTFGCSDTARQYTTVYPKQDFNLTANPNNACSPVNVAFNADPGAYKYEWDFGDGNLILGVHQNSKLFINDSNNQEDHTIVLYTTSVYGCLDTTETSISVLPSPTTLFEPIDFDVCSPKVVEFTNNTQNITNSYWKFGDGTSATTNGNDPIDHTYTNSTLMPANYSIRLITENSFGCKDSLDGFTTVNPEVSASISGPSTDCAPYEVSFSNNSVGAYDYLWDFGDGNTSADFYGKNIFNNETNSKITYDVSMIASSVYGCSDTAYSQITVLPSPKTDFEPNDFTVCSPKTVEFTNHTPNITNSYWNFGDGTSQTTSGNDKIEHTYTNSTFIPIDFRIRLITENSFGCKDSMDGHTSVNPIVTASITGSDEGCSPIEVSFGNESTGANSFIWDYGDGNTSSGYLGLNSFTNNTNDDQEFNISLIALSAFGCSDTAYSSVNVYATPQPEFSVTPEFLQMPESTVNLNNLTQGDLWSYDWNFGDENSSNNKQPGSYTYQNSGKFTITLKAYSNQCENSTQKEIEILPNLPTVEYGPNAEGCSSLTVEFYSETFDTENYLWEFGDGNISTSANPKHTYFSPGEYNVKLTVTGKGGQTIKDDLTINVFPQPQAFFEAFPKVVTVPGQSVSFANKSIDAVEYFWDFGNGDSSSEFSPVYEYQKPGNYDVSLEVTNEFGCKDNHVLNEPIIALEGGDIDFPNAFTPNLGGPNSGEYVYGDKNNYVFYPTLQEGIVEYKMQIFSRWGQLMFESNDLKLGWNGYYNNKICAQGVYIWKVTCRFSTGEVKVFTGDVTLIR